MTTSQSFSLAPGIEMKKTVTMMILKRCAHYLFVVWLVITILFLALVLMKGNPVSLFLDPRLSPELQVRLKKIHGYDRPPLEQYLNYLKNVSGGELGISFMYKRPVKDVLASRLGKTLWLGGLSYCLGTVLCLLLLMGLNLPRSAWLRRGWEMVYLLFLTVPSFIFATLFIAILGVRLKLFPIFGSRDIFAVETFGWQAFLNMLFHSVLPAFSLALPMAGQFTSYLHEQMRILDGKPYILSARGRGVSEWRIFLNHKLRSLLSSFIQLAGLYLPMIAGGALVLEAMFGWSGMGLVLVDATLARDYPLLLGGCLLTAFFVIPGYELSDYVRETIRRRGGHS